MRCDQAREMLYDTPRGMRRVFLQLHLLRCPFCGAEAEQVRGLDGALADLPRFKPHADLLASILAAPQDNHSIAVRSKEASRMSRTKKANRIRRVAYAGLAMLAIAGVVVVSGLFSKPDGRAVLIQAAYAMDVASSIHIVGRGSEGAQDTPSGTRMTPGHFEFWVSAGVMYGRVLAPDGVLMQAHAINPDTGEYWHYTAEEGTLYVADITPISAQAAVVVANVSRMIGSGSLRRVLDPAVDDVEESVSIETRDGRKVSVVTFTGTVTTSPRRVIGRFVCEVDAETNRLLTMRQYAQAEGAPEELVGAIDQMQYDVPAPADLAAFTAPEGTKTVQATATIEETEHIISLNLRAEGARVCSTAAPRD